MLDSKRRDEVVSAAIAAGKFGRDRANHYLEMHDRDPAGTEAVLAALAPTVDAGSVLAGAQTEPYPRSLFPELGRQPVRGRTMPAAGVARAAAEQVRPVPVPAATGSAELSNDVVAGWSRSLFPETADTGAGRVSKARD